MLGLGVLAVDALAVWFTIAVSVVGIVRERRRAHAERALVPVHLVAQEQRAAAHRSDRPRPGVPWRVGVEVSFDLAS